MQIEKSGQNNKVNYSCFGVMMQPSTESTQYYLMAVFIVIYSLVRRW